MEEKLNPALRTGNKCPAVQGLVEGKGDTAIHFLKEQFVSSGSDISRSIEADVKLCCRFKAFCPSRADIGLPSIAFTLGRPTMLSRNQTAYAVLPT
jgi:hypothetical protein